MNQKAQTVAALAESTASQLTSSHAEWTAFLEAVGRLYKYPYSEQVLIYAQRPEATACASYDVWNTRMGRSVRRGSKGIGLLSSDGVRYVFDISDTVGRDGSRRPYLWEYRDEHSDAVTAALAEKYGITDEGGLPYQLEAIAQELAGEYWEQNWVDILASTPGSFLEDLDELNVEVAFREAATVSTTYALLSRCGLNPGEYFSHEDFQPVFDFNTPDAITALGTAVSTGSEQVLRQIEVTIKNFERTRRIERRELYGEQPDLLAGGGLPAAQVRGGNAIDFGEIRTDEGAVSSGGAPGAVQPADTQREADGSSDRNRADGGPAVGADNAGAEGEHGPDRTDEGQRPHEVGGPDEQREGESGGNDTQRADLPVTLPAIDYNAVGPTGLQFSHRALNTEVIPYFEDVSEKRELLLKSDALKKRQVEVAEYFAANSAPDERISFVKSLFNNTYTEIILDSRQRVGYRAYDDVLHLWRGAYTSREQEEYLSWEDVASSIEGLMQDGLWAEPMEQLTLQVDVPEEPVKDEDYIPNLFELAGSTIPLISKPVESTVPVRPLVSQEVIDMALTLGANDRESRLRIIAEFMKGKSLEENTRFLQKHYKENGAGFYIGERKYSLWYNEADLQIAPGESALTFTAAALTWEQAAERIRELLDEGKYAGQAMLYRAWPYEKNRVAEALEYLHRDIDDEYKGKYLPTLTAALSGNFGYPDVVDKTKELLEQPEQLKSVIDEFALFQKDYAHNRNILRFHFHRPDEIMQGLQDLQRTPLKFTASPDFVPVERFFISQDEIDALLKQGNGHEDYRITVFTFFEQHPDRKEREKYLSSLHGVYSGYHGGNDNITYTHKELTFTHGDIIEPYAAVKMKWSQVCKRIEELIKKDAFLSPEDREIMESRTLETPAEETSPLETAKALIRKLWQSDHISPDFSDPSRVLLTNAITENEKHGIQVFADLNNYRLLFEVNGQNVASIQCHDLDDLCEHIENMTAADMISFAKEQYVIRNIATSEMSFDELVTLENDSAGDITVTPNSESAQILDSTFNYRRLSQMKAGCEYFLGAGNRKNTHLWEESIYSHIKEMRRIYDLLPEKPEWLTMEEIDSYAQRMAPRYQVVVYHSIINGFDEMPEYQTLQEAEQIARDFVSGKKVDYVYENMEEDGFHYEGAAVFDVQERQWLFVEGYFPVLEGDKELPYLPYKIEDTPAQSQPVQEQSPTVRELYEKYKAMVIDALENDQPYRNACQNSDKDTAYLEGGAAIKRVVLAAGDDTLTKLYFDNTKFHNDLHREAPDETYPLFSQPEQVMRPEDNLTDLQIKAIEIAKQYQGLPLQEKLNIIAQTFGCATGKIETSPCTGKWRGTSDISIRFDKGMSIFIGNELTPKAKTLRVQNERVNNTLVWYNPEIVGITKETALPALRQREANDNAIAAEKGLKPYTLINVELHDGTKDGGYIGWYYVTLAVDGKIFAHLESGLNHDISHGKVSGDITREKYFIAGALKETEVDYVFNNVGHSSTAELYTLHISDEVRERAEQALAERNIPQSIVDTATKEITGKGLEILNNLDFQRYMEKEMAEDLQPELVQQPRDPLAPAYKAGDTVYLDNTEFAITEVGLFDVQLQDPTLSYPVLRSESKENFEKLLRRDDRNLPITDYFPIAEISPADNGDDLRDVLTSEGGLLDEQTKNEVSGWLQEGMGNEEIARRLGEKYDRTDETMTLETGEQVDYSVHGDRIMLDIRGKSRTVMMYDLRTVAGALRAMYQQEMGGQKNVMEPPHKPGNPRYTVVSDEFGDEAQPFTIWDSWNRLHYVETGDLAVKFSTRGEAQTYADKINGAMYAAKPVAIYPAEKNDLPFDVVIEKVHVGEPKRRPVPQNFHITDDELGAGGAKAKYQMNMAALKTLHDIETENRTATPEEQETLSKYVGWGALADAFDESKPSWTSEYKELLETLTPEEYDSARASTLNAHYTSPTVIKAMYQALENMGFHGGNILDESVPRLIQFNGTVPLKTPRNKAFPNQAAPSSLFLLPGDGGGGIGQRVQWAEKCIPH